MLILKEWLKIKSLLMNMYNENRLEERNGKVEVALTSIDKDIAHIKGSA